MPAVKLNISLNDKTAQTLRRRAAECRQPASKYLADLIERDEKRALDELAEEGYRLLSADTKEVAEAFWPLIRETLPPWDEEDTAHGTEAEPR